MTGSSALASARTLLFVPGSRPDRFEKAYASEADIVIIDLEDAVRPGDKESARRHATAWIERADQGRIERTAIRINAAGTPWHAADVAILSPLGAALVVPEAEPGETLAEVAGGSGSILALIETARGVLGAASVAATPGVVRLALGTFDLAAELGVDPKTRTAMAPARSALVLASASAALPGPVDGVWGAVDDEDGLRDETVRGRDVGLTGKLCIHPSQVAPVHAALRPTARDVAWATEVVAAAAAGSGVLIVRGQMVDRPVVERARNLLGNLNKIERN